jgi:hypothetical protein
LLSDFMTYRKGVFAAAGLPHFHVAERRVSWSEMK